MLKWVGMSAYSHSYNKKGYCYPLADMERCCGALAWRLKRCTHTQRQGLAEHELAVIPGHVERRVCVSQPFQEPMELH